MKNMFDRLKLMEDRFDELSELLSQMEIINDIKKFTALAKEQSRLSKTVDKFRLWKDLTTSQNDLNEMLADNDPEIKAMAEMELSEVKEKLVVLEAEITLLLVPKDPNDEKNVIVEIRGAAGGDEANIFAGDLFRMYTKYSEHKGWKIEILNAMESSMGGFSQIEFMIKGDDVFSYMKYESGAHRVQRVPETEAMGRVHTSTSTVLVMPEAEEIDFELNMNELRFDTFCSSGPGGQSVNTTKSAVRVTHEPSGLSVSCQEGKSQHENKDKAIMLLKTRMYDKIVSERTSEEDQKRRSLIGKGDRSEKVRTYNYPQNRVTDHRINLTVQRLDDIINGKLDLIIEPLVNEDQKQKLLGES
ncbi:MAG: peptide chain release factor 1 [Erysipelotrichales bacterium]|nr:peptide chain release factor 1 [Erysipelotrichales bacterium]